MELSKIKIISLLICTLFLTSIFPGITTAKNLVSIDTSVINSNVNLRGNLDLIKITDENPDCDIDNYFVVYAGVSSLFIYKENFLRTVREKTVAARDVMSKWDMFPDSIVFWVRQNRQGSFSPIYSLRKETSSAGSIFSENVVKPAISEKNTVNSLFTPPNSSLCGSLTICFTTSSLTTMTRSSSSSINVLLIFVNGLVYKAKIFADMTEHK